MYFKAQVSGLCRVCKLWLDLWNGLPVFASPAGDQAQRERGYSDRELDFFPTTPCAIFHPD